MNPPINFLPWRQQRRTAFLRFWLLMFVAPLLLAVGITLILRLTGSAEARIDAVLLQAEQQLARSLQITKPRLLERQQLREQRLQRQLQRQFTRDWQSALEALAANVTAFDGVVCPILDARAQQVYGAIFKNGERVLEDTVEKLAVFLDRVEAMGENALFLGDGAPGFKNAIRERLGEKARFVSAQHMGLRAGSACALAAKRLEAGEEPLNYLTLLPLYLRAPQAERERAAREAAKHE